MLTRRYGDFTLKAFDVLFEELPDYQEVAEVPIVGHSMMEEFHGANAQRYDFNLFFKGIRTPVSIEYNMRSRLVSLDVAGKPKNSWSDIQSFAEAFSTWYNFTHEGHKLSIRMRTDEDGEQTEIPDLDIDGVSYNDYPFMDKDFGKFNQGCS